MMDQPEAIIRRLEQPDAPEWLRLRSALWPDADREDLAQELEMILQDANRQPVFVAVRPDGGLCGIVEVSLHEHAPGCQTSPVGYLEGWYVEPTWRGQGVGRALVEAAEMWARSQGCLEMASDTNDEYPVSPAVHAALGYREIERAIYFAKKLE
ncbi:MAG TPA: GNAT family N-acetyltransferase [Anaerolineaceae bacterium]|jgi:aminoglycoside 6'-N-acetyltransferase I